MVDGGRHNPASCFDRDRLPMYLAVYAHVGAGTLVLLSSPAPLQNRLLGQVDDAAFAIDITGATGATATTAPARPHTPGPSYSTSTTTVTAGQEEGSEACRDRGRPPCSSLWRPYWSGCSPPPAGSALPRRLNVSFPRRGLHMWTRSRRFSRRLSPKACHLPPSIFRFAPGPRSAGVQVSLSSATDVEIARAASSAGLSDGLVQTVLRTPRSADDLVAVGRASAQLAQDRWS